MPPGLSGGSPPGLSGDSPPGLSGGTVSPEGVPEARNVTGGVNVPQLVRPHPPHTKHILHFVGFKRTFLFTTRTCSYK